MNWSVEDNEHLLVGFISRISTPPTYKPPLQISLASESTRWDEAESRMHADRYTYIHADTTRRWKLDGPICLCIAPYQLYIDIRSFQFISTT